MSNDKGFFDQLIQQHTATDSHQKNDIDKNLNTQGCAHQPLESGSPAGEPVPEADLTARKGMPPEARRALVSLLRQGVILTAQKAKLFESICRYQIDIRQHLADMYLKLVLDEKSGVAFIASVDEEDTATRTPSADSEPEESISLITRRTLTLFDTLLLLVLRKHYQERETSGEQKVVIDVERVEANLTPFLALTNSSKSDRKKINAALKKMVEKRLLSSVRGSEDRYEITPIIRYVVNAEFLENLLAEYEKLSRETELNTDSNPEKTGKLGTHPVTSPAGDNTERRDLPTQRARP